MERLVSRPARVFVVPLVVLALAVAWADVGQLWSRGHVSLGQFEQDPGSFVGRDISVGFGRVEEILATAPVELAGRTGPAGFVVSTRRGRIEVAGDLPGVELRSVVSVRGIVDSSHRLELRSAHLHSQRRAKWWLSSITLMAVAALVVRELRIA